MKVIKKKKMDVIKAVIRTNAPGKCGSNNHKPSCRTPIGL